MSIYCKLNLFKTSFFKYVPVRYLNLLEYQSKMLLEEHGVTVQKFVVVNSTSRLTDIDKLSCQKYVLKAQIMAGGRGKGHFNNGLLSGIQITSDRNELLHIINQMLGNKLITKQTSQEGVEVKKIMITDFVDVVKETYICFLLDRQRDGPILIASPKGGVDIEKVAETVPQLIKYIPLDYNKELNINTANEVAEFLGFSKACRIEAAIQLRKLWECFKSVDATQIEINPFVETKDGAVLAVDAKLSFDDNAKFRQHNIFANQDTSEIDPRELEASKYDLNYIGMNGNIGCLVNGAGLAMATMDLIKLHGGEPANFLDIGGGVKEDQVRAAIKIITSDPKVKSVLVNIFGGIVNCATIANGIVAALNTLKLDIPLIVRLAGNNAEEAKSILNNSGLNIISADDFEDATIKVVNSVANNTTNKAAAI